MDWVKTAEKAAEYLKKYRYALVILVAGIVLMLLPEGAEKPEAVSGKEIRKEASMESSLQEILSMIQGAGKVAVLLTERKGQETVFQTDEDHTYGTGTDTVHKKTVMTTDPNRQESGLIRQVNPPVLQGAVILCQGADNPTVKLAMVEAVMRATGLPSNCICVLKMK